MKRLLRISERNSKRILSIICLVLALFVPGCLPLDVLDQVFDPDCPFQVPNDNTRCVLTYRTKFGQTKDVSFDCSNTGYGCGPFFVDAVDCVEITSVSCQPK